VASEGSGELTFDPADQVHELSKRLFSNSIAIGVPSLAMQVNGKAGRVRRAVLELCAARGLDRGDDEHGGLPA
jgi:hypothetical protein